MKYHLMFIFFLINISCFSQENKPIKVEEVNTIKKNPELWYVDKTFVGDSVEIRIDTVLNKNTKKVKVKKEPITRDTSEEALDIPEVFFTALKWFFYLAILGAVILLILKGNFRGLNFSKNTAVETEITENTTIESASQLQNIGFEQQILAAEQQSNFRLAVRLYYLWALKKLVNKKLIQFHIKKTNIEYCQELKGNTHFDAFEQCTRFYNYVWYGEFIINENKYAHIKESFTKMLSQI
jgi:hypothetical protein